MPKPRKAQVFLASTPYYYVPLAAYPKHFVGQALRRAFLCGKDSVSSIYP